MAKRLVNRILTEKRSLIAPLAVGLLVNVGIFGLAVYPLRSRVANAESRADRADQMLRGAEAAQTQARDMVEGRDRATAELDRFYKAILPADLAGARRITYLRLAQLAEESNLRYERRTISSDENPKGALARLRMTMVLAGEYEDVRQFIYELETAPEFIVIEDVALAQSEEGQAPLMLTVDLATYYRVNRPDGT